MSLADRMGDALGYAIFILGGLAIGAGLVVAVFAFVYGRAHK
jgi:hypothetical protein